MSGTSTHVLDILKTLEQIKRIKDYAINGKEGGKNKSGSLHLHQQYSKAAAYS